MFAFSINVSFKRLIMFFPVILVHLGTKEYSGMATWVPFIPYKDEAFFIK